MLQQPFSSFEFIESMMKTTSSAKKNVASTKANKAAYAASNVSAKKPSSSAKYTAVVTYTSLGKASKTTKTSNPSKAISNAATNMAKAAGVAADSSENPRINCASEAKAYQEAYKLLKPQYNYKNDPRYQALIEEVSSKNIETYKKEFVMEAFPHALECEQETGIPAEILFGQICTESGYGSDTLTDKYTGKEAHNYFGIKGVGSNGSVICDTTEYINGEKVYIDDKFRAYNNMEESIDDYAKLLKSNYEQYTTSGTPEDWAKVLNKGGYATAPGYGNFILDVANTWGL